MNKRIALTGMIASLAIFSAGSARAFQPKGTQVMVASATTGGTLSASFGITLVDSVNTAAPKTKVDWTSASSGGGWQIANTVLKTTWSVTDSGGGIQIYTDNKNAGATPQFVDPTPTDTGNTDSNPAGLLLQVAGTNESSTALPVAWSIKADTKTVTGATPQLVSADPNDNVLHGAQVDNPNSFQWLYMVDKNTPAIAGTHTDPFANGDPFVTIAKTTGIHFGQKPSEFGGDPDHISYVYIQADFTTAAAQATYMTNKLTVEAYIQ